MKIIPYIILLSLLTSCGVYSFTGGDTSGAKTFSVTHFRAQTPQASQAFTQNLTEGLKDVVLAQSPLNLVTEKGELSFEGAVVAYRVVPVSIQSDETASLNRLEISVKVNYTNSLDKDKSFERTFTKYADYESSQDLFAIEESLWETIIEQLTQEIFNASLGNW